MSIAGKHAATVAIAASAVLLLVLGGCSQPVEAPRPSVHAWNLAPGTASMGPPAADRTHIRFVVLGDQGTGGEGQRQVGAGIEKVCTQLGCDFALALGDNLYPSGTSDPYDLQFETQFEEPYAHLTFPFFVVLGNHDSGGPVAETGGLGAWYEYGDAQVAYSTRNDRTSTKWVMPERYWFHTVGPVRLLGLDTNTLLFDDTHVPPSDGQPFGFQGPAVDMALAATFSPWRIALGHHPYISNGPHGDAGSYDGLAVPGPDGRYFKQFVEQHLCGKVDLYLAGHDHNLQWLEPTTSCQGTQFIVSGGGGANPYPLPGGNTARFQESTLGFWHVDVAGMTLTASAYNAEGELLFQHGIEKRID